MTPGEWIGLAVYLVVGILAATATAARDWPDEPAPAHLASVVFVWPFYMAGAVLWIAAAGGYTALIRLGARIGKARYTRTGRR